ncbi:phage major tail protein, TP901-1 family [Mammaliicoccus sciuri]|uniref:phage major tail protein, TP901-1 family n=1 Tax=Mammaliicoccus sciuri TaxID=1296 RepID=UPI001C4F52D2|nr:phage major tail protein, TP901-1 family [Mammaliicoccus sciuri]
MEIKSAETLLLFRVCGKKVDATKLMFGKEFSFGHEVDSDKEDTFDGAFETGGSSESTFSYTAKMSRKDKFADEVEDATLDKVAYECWIIDSKNPGENQDKDKYKARYFQGYFKKFEMKGEVGGINEYETELKVFARMQRGFATIPDTVKDALDKIGYKFHDTVKSDPATDGLASIPQPVVSEGNTTERTPNTTETN